MLRVVNLGLWASLIFFFGTNFLKAAETDQFYAADAVIKDSSKEMNDYFNEHIEKGLDKANLQKIPLSCQVVASEILTQVLGEFSFKEYFKNKTFSKISHFTMNSPLIDRFPDNSITGSEYRHHSIYQYRAFPANVIGVSRTININGIYIGTDKIGHFSIIGRTYYHNFLEGLAAGLTSEQAQSLAIVKGIRQEVAVLGYTIGGTLSFADLEANYQGLQFARNMCEGNHPHLIFKNGQWVQNIENLFDIRQYINPKMDEAFNVSFWAPRNWKRMKNDIVKSYCYNIEDANYKRREESYRKLVKQNVNDQFIDEFVMKNPQFNRLNQLLTKKICSP
jgi:hypothetical protein